MLFRSARFLRWLHSDQYHFGTDVFVMLPLFTCTFIYRSGYVSIAHFLVISCIGIFGKVLLCVAPLFLWLLPLGSVPFWY